MTRPVGALSEDERHALYRRYGHGVNVKNDRTYYTVQCNGQLDASTKYCFSWKPDEAYYFDNYWHAWAYHLRLRAKK